ncbi:MAG: hypothetical protein ABEH40_03765 [Haloferacaceae archaeon]
MTPETPVVTLVADDGSRLRQYASWLDGACEVRTARDGSGALDAVDRGTDVVVLVRPSALRDGDALAALRERGEDLKVVLVRERDADLAALDRAPDEVLAAPVTREALRRAVAVLAAERAYARGIGDLFSLATERAAREADPPAGGGDGDLDERIAALRDRLDATLDTLVEEAGFEAVYRALADPPADGSDREE